VQSDSTITFGVDMPQIGVEEKVLEANSIGAPVNLEMAYACSAFATNGTPLVRRMRATEPVDAGAAVTDQATAHGIQGAGPDRLARTC
jgi:hypothetical protein